MDALDRNAAAQTDIRDEGQRNVAVGGTDELHHGGHCRQSLWGRDLGNYFGSEIER
jgi:hypothetical protein